jgi:hypothetical protein
MFLSLRKFLTRSCIWSLTSLNLASFCSSVPSKALGSSTFQYNLVEVPGMVGQSSSSSFLQTVIAIPKYSFLINCQRSLGCCLDRSIADFLHYFECVGVYRLRVKPSTISVKIISAILSEKSFSHLTSR